MSYRPVAKIYRAEGPIQLGGVLEACPPRTFSKLEEFLARCHDIQPIKLMHRLNVNDNVSFTMQKPEID